MNILFSSYKAHAQLLAVRSGGVISIEARDGTEVHSRESRVWITQEGDTQDYIVPAGTRFTAHRSGTVVVSALDGAALVSVSWNEPATPSAPAQAAVSLDYANIHQLRRAAARARAREIARLYTRGILWLARAWRNLVSGAAARPQNHGVRS